MNTPLFSDSYREARARFLAAASTAGASVHTQVLPLSGAQGEVLAMDVAVQGPPGATRVLMTTSAVHGIEGFCGSAIQTGLLQHLQLIQQLKLILLRLLQLIQLRSNHCTEQYSFLQEVPLPIPAGDFFCLLFNGHWSSINN